MRFSWFTILAGLAAAGPLKPLEVISSRKLTSCPKGGTLEPGYLKPTLMVPVSAKHPNTAFGPTQFPLITPSDFCTIFNLEIPSTAVSKTCTLEFLFPGHVQTRAPYVYKGEGHFTFTGYAFDSGATPKTTYAHQPPPGPSPPQPPAVLSPGNAYVINVGPCGIQPGAKKMIVSGMLCSSDTTFSYLQSEKLGCPIGFYVEIS